MLPIVNTPQPPYYAVIAPAVLAEDVKGYPQMARHLMEVAQQIDGFLGLETCYQGNFVIAISYWRSLEAIDRWRQNDSHLRAKENARSKWFTQYVTRIARVEQAY